MTLFVQIHDPAGERTVAYQGMDQPTVGALLDAQGIPYDFINETIYTAFVAAHQPVKPTAPELLTQQRADAIGQLLTDAGPIAKYVRAVFLVALDEINALRQRDVDNHTDVTNATTLADLKTRWAARASLGDRTVAQFKTAIQAKINAGTAD